LFLILISKSHTDNVKNAHHEKEEDRYRITEKSNMKSYMK